MHYTQTLFCDCLSLYIVIIMARIVSVVNYNYVYIVMVQLSECVLIK